MTACRHCGKTWGGEKTGHCTRCHETFTTDANFDRHLIIERGPGVYRVAGCMHPAEVVDKKGERMLYERQRGDSIVWSAPGLTETIEAEQ